MGGGGLSSSIKFFELINYLIEEFPEKEVRFTIIKGNSNFKFNRKKNVKIIKWSNHLNDLFSKTDLIVSEAGYFTLLDIIQTNIPAIMIPGKRGIDNQELRAVSFELLGAGKMHFPFQNKGNLKEIVYKIIQSPEEIKGNIISRKIICKNIFGGKNVFDKLIEEINKNEIN